MIEIVCVVLAVALVGMFVLAARERAALMRQWAAERDQLLRAALASNGREFVEMDRAAKYGDAVVEQARSRVGSGRGNGARLEPMPAPEGLG